MKLQLLLLLMVTTTATTVSNDIKHGYLSRYRDGLRAGWPGFDSWQGQDFSRFLVVQTGAHPASSPLGTGVLSQGVKLREANN
jgi:hypothetical protein